MRMIWDWRYVSAEELAAFRTADSADFRERAYAVVLPTSQRRAQEQQQPPVDEAAFHAQFMKDIPLGYIEMRQAFAATGEYGKWLRERHAVVKINGIVFLHGGISAATAALGCAGINEAVRRDLAVPNPTPEQALAMLSSSETGPLWYRGLAEEPEPAFAPALTNILELLGARAIVVGHTVTADFRITRRFDGRVIQIDTGMLGGAFYPGGMASALEIRGDMLTAIYQNGRERLSAPPAPVQFRRPSESARKRIQDRRLPAFGDLGVEQLHDGVAPREHGPDFGPREAAAHRLGHGRFRQRSHVFQERPLDAHERGRPLQVVSEPEGARVVDHPHLPVAGPHDVAHVPIAIGNELVEDPHDVRLHRRPLGVGAARLRLQPLLLIHHHVVNPPGDGCPLALDAPFDRHRHVVEPQQHRQPVAGDVVAIVVLEVHFGRTRAA